MGRKKKKVVKPWCWYCNREFDDDKILIQHQKAKHFKCHICHKKLYTGPGLAIHCMQVHKESIERIPNSIPARGSTEIEIYGMEGVPEEDLKYHDLQKLGKSEEPPEKRPREETPYFLPGPSPSLYQMVSGMNAMPGASPGGVPLPPLPVPGKNPSVVLY
ncbi:unnamed protein product [Soboliphyme baturini]|uniref:BED-type domain-containing protein n=1 Tax=Soboliphyme baturini TaxID=241478 RepID=A0A183J3Q9_9BILA|nr:unnamed protein product [Soboliphyme baturini]